MTKPEIILGVYLFPDKAKKRVKGAWGNKNSRLTATASSFKIKSKHPAWQAITSNRIDFGASCQELLIPFTHSPLQVQFPVANWRPDPANLCSPERSGLVSRAASCAGGSGASKHTPEPWRCCAHQLDFLPGAGSAKVNNYDTTLTDVSEV